MEEPTDAALLASFLGGFAEAPAEFAGALVSRFGSLADVIAASPGQLRRAGATNTCVARVRMIRTAAERVAHGKLAQQPKLGSYVDAAEYCRMRIGLEEREMFMLIFLDKKNGLIADEIVSSGTVDHVAVYPREIIRLALEHNAASVIMSHNHPSGDPTPSTQDVKMTLGIIAACTPLSIAVHDHIIVGSQGTASLRGLRLI